LQSAYYKKYSQYSRFSRMNVQGQNSVEILKSRVLKVLMTVKREMLGRVWCKANYTWDIYRVVKGVQLGKLCVHYYLTDLHANSRKIMSLRTCGDELEYCEDVVF
jgi:hypothetical protein